MRTIKLLVLAMFLWGGIAIAQDNKGDFVEDFSSFTEFIEGGIDGFRMQVMNNFDVDAVDELEHLTYEQKRERLKKIRKKEPVEDIILQTRVIFIVEIDGYISDVKAYGSNNSFNMQAEKAVKSVKGKWKPAEVNGNSVRSKFSFPMNMRFE